MMIESSKPGSRHICWLYRQGSDQILVSPDWADTLTERQLRCIKCKFIREDRRDEAMLGIDEVVLHELPKRTPYGAVFMFDGFVIHQEFIDIIGMERLEETCYRRPIRLEGQGVLSHYQYFIKRQIDGCFRGSTSSKISLCEDCGRLFYLPLPAKDKYLLDQYWPAGKDVAVVKDSILCTEQFYKEKLRNVPRLKFERRQLQREPMDGLPVELAGLISEIRGRGKMSLGG